MEELKTCPFCGGEAKIYKDCGFEGYSQYLSSKELKKRITKEQALRAVDRALELYRGDFMAVAKELEKEAEQEG